jgi:formate hydrogenlyase subunit 3/multisubunit Na+/H+ antiporter MnhD subunit
MATADSHMEFVIATILAISVVEIVYYFRVISRLYFRKAHAEIKVQHPRWNGLLAMGILSVVIIAVGLRPDLISHLLSNAADDLMNKAAYIQQIIPNLVSQKPF